MQGRFRLFFIYFGNGGASQAYKVGYYQVPGKRRTKIAVRGAKPRDR